MRTAAVVGISFTLVTGAAAACGPHLPLGLDLHRPVPGENPLTPERIALGRRVFARPAALADR